MDIASDVRGVILEKMLDGDLFTAFDITTELRSLTDEEIAHSDVNQEIKAMHDRQEIRNSDGCYGRTSIATPNGKSWLYHPQTATQDTLDTYAASLNKTVVGRKIELD